MSPFHIEIVRLKYIVIEHHPPFIAFLRNLRIGEIHLWVCLLEFFQGLPQNSVMLVLHRVIIHYLKLLEFV
jgi:hypothetical protein